jgi:transcriptional regulator with XRE-family HTH domain
MAHSIDFSTATSDQIEKALCERLEQIRLARNVTQENLAQQAGVAVRTIRNLEKGAGVSFDTAIRVMTALGVQQALESLLPDPTIRPVERVQARASERRRASSQVKTEVKTWTWADGDDGEDGDES